MGRLAAHRAAAGTHKRVVVGVDVRGDERAPPVDAHCDPVAPVSSHGSAAAAACWPPRRANARERTAELREVVLAARREVAQPVHRVRECGNLRSGDARSEQNVPLRAGAGTRDHTEGVGHVAAARPACRRVAAAQAHTHTHLPLLHSRFRLHLRLRALRAPAAARTTQALAPSTTLSQPPLSRAHAPGTSPSSPPWPLPQALRPPQAAPPPHPRPPPLHPTPPHTHTHTHT